MLPFGVAVLADGSVRTVDKTAPTLSGFVCGFRLKVGCVFKVITLLNPDYFS
jgi:hypothetical protein